MTHSKASNKQESTVSGFSPRTTFSVTLILPNTDENTTESPETTGSFNIWQTRSCFVRLPYFPAVRKRSSDSAVGRRR